MAKVSASGPERFMAFGDCATNNLQPFEVPGAGECLTSSNSLRRVSIHLCGPLLYPTNLESFSRRQRDQVDCGLVVMLHFFRTSLVVCRCRFSDRRLHLAVLRQRNRFRLFNSGICWPIIRPFQHAPPFLLKVFCPFVSDGGMIYQDNKGHKDKKISQCF